MRSFSVSTLYPVHAIGAVTRGLHTAHRRSIRALVGLCVAITLVTSTVGDDDPPGGGQHEQPWLEDLAVYFDGIDQYAIVGNVTHCDEIGDVRIDIGGIFGDQWTTTEFDGSFFLFLIHEPVPSGSIVSAIATCHEGISSDRMTAEVD